MYFIGEGGDKNVKIHLAWPKVKSRKAVYMLGAPIQTVGSMHDLVRAWHIYKNELFLLMKLSRSWWVSDMYIQSHNLLHPSIHMAFFKKSLNERCHVTMVCHMTIKCHMAVM